MQKSYALILLGAIGAGLGLLRDIILVHSYGFNSDTDTIYLYLAPTYIISVLGDSIRLTTVNLIGSHSKSAIRKSIFPLIASASCACLGYHLITLPSLNTSLLITSAFAGLMNLYAVHTITTAQAYGTIIRAQIAFLLPHALLIPISILSYQIPPQSFVYIFVISHAAIPITQIAFIKWSTHCNYRQSTPETLSNHPNTSLPFQHGLPLYGTMLFSYSARVFLGTTGEGHLSIFLLLSRITDSARSIIADTFIAGKLSHWLQARSRLHQRINFPVYGLLTATTIPFCLLPYSSKTEFTYVVSAILLASFAMTSNNRVIYFQLNANRINTKLIRANALCELCFALISYSILAQNTIFHIFGLWIWLILRPLCSSWYIDKSFVNADKKQKDD